MCHLAQDARQGLADMRSAPPLRQYARKLPNPRKCWIQAALIKITPCDKIGQGLRRAHKHVICDDPRTTCNRTKADAGKDIRIVSLPRDKGFAIKFDGRKGTS